jgi:hypothetical protein
MSAARPLCRRSLPAGEGAQRQGANERRVRDAYR